MTFKKVKGRKGYTVHRLAWAMSGRGVASNYRHRYGLKDEGDYARSMLGLYKQMEVD